MAQSCSKCRIAITNRLYLICAICKKVYDLCCANVSEKLFCLMDVERKAAWRCNDCIHGCSSSPLMQPSIRCNDSFNDQEDNVTLRRKYKANVSTENSFDALSLDEDVEDLSMFLLKRNGQLNRSCPDIRSDNFNKIEVLQNKVAELTQKLEIAENEITNLLTENCCLKKQISLYDVRVSQLRDICKSTPKKPQRRNGNSLNRTRLDFSSDQNTPRKPKDRAVPEHMKPPQASTVGSEDAVDKLCSAKNKIKNGNMYIIGDEQVKGLSTRLCSMKFNKWNEKYNIQGLVKPHASSTEILGNFEGLLLKIKEGDIIVVSVGKHDKNPYLFLTNLYNFLRQLKHCKVFLLNVTVNRNLNVNKLNNEIRMLIKNYENCKFLEIKDMFKRYNQRSILDLMTFKLNLILETNSVTCNVSNEFVNVCKNHNLEEAKCSGDVTTGNNFLSLPTPLQGSL